MSICFEWVRPGNCTLHRTCTAELSVYMAALVFLQVSAQVTFSRDWTAGKRSDPGMCEPTTKSATTLCQLLLVRRNTCHG
uniref:Uncharacterized protein n=1 Tax=Timema shepardi TaxID=629360 RepID=A0A7R9B6H2_TIMSH|nr:unnamed protein product [Timema shepardi]